MSVRVVDAGAEIEVQVEDSGVGIPASALPTIFESYQEITRLSREAESLRTDLESLKRVEMRLERCR